MPKKGATERDVAVATRLVPDPRATHFWDGSGVTMREYQKLLRIPAEAWDVYFLYPPGARWTDSLPPAPVYWMHQMGVLGGPNAPAPRLDPDELARHTNMLLQPAAAPPAAQP
ncbi:MAG TPA: hypothetical protein VJU87_03500 [Gemmatimonadaceae bacterium]|nr:hypothetical protein [Gemmatimonadaceae bacterium]